jgi:RES domain-containing protein
MPSSGRVHDRAILDALDAIDPETFEGDVWRVARKGRDGLRGSSAHGRWSPNGEFEVLYTSLLRDGALAEIGYRLSLEPVWPSRIEHEIHTIEVKTGRTLRFADVNSLGALGVDVAKYETFDYSATQPIAAAAHFLEFDGLIVPSARAPCSNLVVFLDRLSEGCGLELKRTESVNWAAWRKTSRKR